VKSLMPHDTALERAAIASCLAWPEQLLELPLNETDFFSEAHRKVWNAINWLHAEGEAVDTIRVQERLASVNQLAGVGGLDFLLNLTDTIPVRNPPTRRLKELTRLRALSDQLARVGTALERVDYEQCVALAAGVQVLGETTDDAEILSGWDCAEAAFEVLAGRSQQVLSVHPGLTVMREMVDDLEIGSVTILGADTNVGKSSIALEMVLGAAERQVVAGYVSREDLKLLIGRRFLSALSGIPARRIKQKVIHAAEWPRLSNAAVVLQGMSKRVLVNAQRGGNELDVCAAMTRMAQRGAKMVVVDYVQAISSSQRTQDRRNEVMQVAKRIGAHANRVGVALVLLSQLTVPQNAKPGDEPGKHWLKETRDLANMADNIILAWREEESEWAAIRLKLAKGKDGCIGNTWAMIRDKDTGRLQEVT
jgi:replicative DNA helicase